MCHSISWLSIQFNKVVILLSSDDTAQNVVYGYRAPTAKKSPAMGNTAPSNPGGRAGNKKAVNVKDPKQGNIMSFFKKV